MALAGYAWLVLLLAIAIFEGWATVKHRPTLSQWVWWYTPKHRWFAYVVVLSMAFLMLHFFLPR